jgi:YegS/Rv2252/BmrU family lipid kinase
MLPLIIVNPSSAAGATGDAWPGIASELATHFGAFNCEFTKERGDAVRYAREGAQNGRQFVIACGGDGTISEAANGILESGVDVELGILPSGTGGDFQKSIKVPKRLADAVTALRKGRTRRIDVGRVTYVNHDGDKESRFFLGVASFGMSGDVIRRVKENDSSWLGGKAAFAVAMLQTTITKQNTTAVVQLDDHLERRLTVANLCVANGRYFGGGMKIAPEAKLDDGKFDVVTLGDLSALKILTNAHQLYLGTHLGMKQVQNTLATRVSARPFTSEEHVAIEVDGELPGFLPATFEMLPLALRIRVPLT